MREPALRLMELATGYWQAAALSAAVEVGLFDVLGRAGGKGATADALADACGLSPRYTAGLCDALAGLGLLEKSNDGYAIAAAYEPLLNPSGARSMIEALRFNAAMYPLWGRLTDSVRSGRPAAPAGAHLGGDEAATRRFVMGMHSRALGLAEAILPGLDVDGIGQLLDVGSGPGTFSRLLAERRDELNVSQFDLPGVLNVARELTADSPAADRIAFRSGDYRRDALPDGFDAVMYCGALHQESPSTAAALAAKLYDAVRPGGRAMVVDLMTEPGGTDPAFSALFSLNMMLFDAEAGVWPTDRAEALLADAGFGGITTRRLGDSPYYAVTGSRGSSRDAMEGS